MQVPRDLARCYMSPVSGNTEQNRNQARVRDRTHTLVLIGKFGGRPNFWILGSHYGCKLPC